MMADQSRRHFLKQTAAMGSILTLGSRAAGAQDTAAEKPLDMCIARWKGTPDPAEPTTEIAPKLTEKAIEALGGMKRFVSRGDVVWIKPNIAWDRTPEQAANTNPDVVKTVIRLCLEAGAKTVKVGDNPCNDANKTYVRSGIEAAAKEAGAEVIYVDHKRFRTMMIGGRLKEHPVYPEMIEADLMINIPVAKHHNLPTVTLCMKNYMGVVENRSKFHQDIPGCLCDITAFMKPRICILDAMRILMRNGPTGGNVEDVKRLNTIAAGTDIVALDAFGSELLGHKPADIPSVVAGDKAGLGKMDYRSLALKEIELS